MTDLSLLRNPAFLIPCLANLFAAIGLFIPFVYIVDRAVSFGVEPETAAFLLSVTGMSRCIFVNCYLTAVYYVTVSYVIRYRVHQ